MNTNSNNPIEIAKQVQQEKKADIKREPIDCGHFLAEESPEEVIDEIQKFFAVS